MTTNQGNQTRRPDGGIGRRNGLKIRRPLKACGFETLSGHQSSLVRERASYRSASQLAEIDTGATRPAKAARRSRGEGGLFNTVSGLRGNDGVSEATGNAGGSEEATGSRKWCRLSTSRATIGIPSPRVRSFGKTQRLQELPDRNLQRTG